MHTDIFDRYKAARSPVHRLDPRVKAVVSVLFILSNVLLPDGAWVAYLLSWGLVLFVSYLTGLGLGYSLKRSFIAVPFALAAVTAVFALPGRPIAILNLGALNLVATNAGVLRFVSVLIRSWLSVQVAVLLVATTQFPDLVHALRHLHVPKVLVAVISFMYRYLFVLVDEAMRLLRAREARSARPAKGGGGGSLGWRARVSGNMAGQLFLRSYERSERVYNAMLARGYQGQLMTLNPHKMRSSDWVIGITGLVVLMLLQIAGRVWH
jgi:cobalt/nickel transport system permease protein